jgi:hypothetical protein
MLANRLIDREHVPFVEALFERGTAMPGGAERDPLLGRGEIGNLSVVGRNEFGHVDEHCGLGGQPCKSADLPRLNFWALHSAPSRWGWRIELKALLMLEVMMSAPT